MRSLIFKINLNSRDIAVNQAILFSAWMPKNGHENDEIISNIPISIL